MERAPKPKVRSRRPPDLPRELTRQSDGAKLFHGEDLAISHVALRDTKLDAISSHHLQLDSAILERVALAGSRFASIHLRDVRFLGCDLANVETRALTAIRVEFVDCHMTGFRVTEGCQADDVLIAEGSQQYAQFVAARFRFSEFVDCNLIDAAFGSADLRGCIFRGCALRNADFSDAKLEGVDLRGSAIEGLRLGPRDVRGVIVEPAQAMVLSTLLGICIR